VKSLTASGSRHCEERSDEAIQSRRRIVERTRPTSPGSLRFARDDGGCIGLSLRALLIERPEPLQAHTIGGDHMRSRSRLAVLIDLDSERFFDRRSRMPAFFLGDLANLGQHVAIDPSGECLSNPFHDSSSEKDRRPLIPCSIAAPSPHRGAKNARSHASRPPRAIVGRLRRFRRREMRSRAFGP
jgi:hypothetical protein